MSWLDDILKRRMMQTPDEPAATVQIEALDTGYILFFARRSGVTREAVRSFDDVLQRVKENYIGTD
jgi:3-hydroxyisobutyrate dehydrogenase-like beta-hydroxyacid dehydrogenase